MSHESEIVWNFVKFVLAPLRDVRGESRVDVLSQLRGLLADAERSPQNARKPVEEELTIEPGFKIDGHANAQARPAALDGWLTSVKLWSDRERSIARELEVLRVLEESPGAVGVKRVCARMRALGLCPNDGDGAVVTQLSRLKKKGIVAKEAQGLYLGTAEGLGRLRKMRTLYGTLVVPDEIRKLVA